MRLLLSAILFLFSQVISLQNVQGKGIDIVRITAAQVSFKSKNLYFGQHSKSRTNFEKTFQDDLNVVSHQFKKFGMASFFMVRGLEKLQPPLVFDFRVYDAYSHFSYAYILDFLYPKHVFW